MIERINASARFTDLEGEQKTISINATIPTSKSYSDTELLFQEIANLSNARLAKASHIESGHTDDGFGTSFYYASIEDVAHLEIRNNLGFSMMLNIPAPKEELFDTDFETIIPAKVSAILSALQNYLNVQGLYLYKGWRTRSKTKEPKGKNNVPTP